VKTLAAKSRKSLVLKQLNQHEQRVDHELDVLLGNKERLQRSMRSLMRLKHVFTIYVAHQCTAQAAVSAGAEGGP
jgi:hypothetical protein